MKKMLLTLAGLLPIAALVIYSGAWIARAEDAHEAGTTERAEMRAATRVIQDYVLRQQVREEIEAAMRGDAVPLPPMDSAMPDGYMRCPGKPERVCTADGHELR